VNRETISNQANVKRPVYSGNIEHCSPLQFKYAMMTDMEVESITNLSLYNFINDWWSTRYKYGGDDRNGIDCSAFTEKILSAVYQIKAPSHCEGSI
jgi:lipoprotein Spr